MSDDKTRARGQDRERINVNEDYEVRDWSRKFGISADELRAAVQAVGDRAVAVEAYVKGRGRH